MNVQSLIVRSIQVSALAMRAELMLRMNQAHIDDYTLETLGYAQRVPCEEFAPGDPGVVVECWLVADNQMVVLKYRHEDGGLST